LQLLLQRVSIIDPPVEVRLSISAAEEAAERRRVAYGAAASVVVEVGEHVPAGGVPFAQPLRPPGEILVGVGTAVQVVVIGAVEADVDERGAVRAWSGASWTRRTARFSPSSCQPAKVAGRGQW